MNESVYSFSELKGRDLAWAGGKGGTLARLSQKGYPVPDGLVILPKAFEGDEMGPHTWNRVQSYLGKMRKAKPGTAFAVRSSALGEDSITSSFAGQYYTVLAVGTDDQVLQAVREVRRSRNSERVRAYCAAIGMKTPPDMAVVVQQMVPADLAGILFTADPLTGSRNTMTGNFIFGLGDALVSGQVEPYTFTLQRSGSFNNFYSGAPALKPFARRLHKLGRRLEWDMGSPQDIEWAVAGGKLYLLQSRPITTMNTFNQATGEFNDSLGGDYLWSNVNAGEAAPDIYTHLSWTLAQDLFESFGNVLPGFYNSGNIGGRPYLNLSVLASVYKLLGLREKKIRKALEFMCTRIPGELTIPTLSLPSGYRYTMLVNFVALKIKWNRGYKKLPEYLKENPNRCDKLKKRIQEAKSPKELENLWRCEIEPHLLQGAQIYLGTGTRMYFVSKLRSRLSGMLGAADADLLISNTGCASSLAGDFEPLASLGPVLGTARVASGKMDREAYLARYGHRGPNELELAVPRPAEDPAWLQDQLRLFTAFPVDVDALLTRQRDRFTSAWKRFRANYPFRSLFIGHRIRKAARYNQEREAGRSEYTRDRWVARAFAIRAGELTGLGQDIFFLTIKELLAFMAGDFSPVQYLPMRKEKHGQYADLPVYPPFIRGRFDPFSWAADPERPLDVYDASAPRLRAKTGEGHQNDTVIGMAVSAGRVTGLVRRLDRPEDGEQLQKGEILVTAFTDIAWTPLFLRAAAIVTDIGAPLSHAAIVARELGIPAVVGCGNATIHLQSGDRVLVDGGQGIVEVIQGREVMGR